MTNVLVPPAPKAPTLKLSLSASNEAGAAAPTAQGAPPPPLMRDTSTMLIELGAQEEGDEELMGPADHSGGLSPIYSDTGETPRDAFSDGDDGIPSSVTGYTP